MKKLILLFYILLFFSTFAQKGRTVTISLEKQSIDVSLNGDNINKEIKVHSNTRSNGQMKILNSKWQEEKEWNRSFEIFDSTDNPLIKIPAFNQSSYQVSVKQLRSSLKKGSIYSLYTMAIPKDPNRAATVRVRRMLVCNITVK